MSLWFLVTALATINASPLADPLPIIGVDGDGNVAEYAVSARQYTQELTHLVASVQDTALPVLRASQTRHRCDTWMLRRVGVGVTFGLQVGIGSLFKLALLPQFRLQFANIRSEATP